MSLTASNANEEGEGFRVCSSKKEEQEEKGAEEGEGFRVCPSTVG